jgi:hypothetical protein
MRHPFLHHHRSDLQTVVRVRQLTNQVDLVHRPFVLVYRYLAL